MMKIMPLILCVFILAACATPYQPMGYRGGYSNMQLSDDIYKVTFAGNGFSSREYVNDLLLYRCAELANENRYDYFLMLNDSENKTESQYTTPSTISSQSTGFSSGSFSGNTYSGSNYENTNAVIQNGQTYNISKYDGAVIIKLLHDNKKEPFAFKAQTILNQISVSRPWM
ncbi:MAG: hypothetical protein A2103_03770 [Gammaproteobacteria bacterium GWF2_41_13]|nr:MAG: hypothetical protein A2103_03770 [Gammaproteobacteria bacterium GWF2_41_13]